MNYFNIIKYCDVNKHYSIISFYYVTKLNFE